ncbi:B3 domain-containing protein At2g31420 [Linum grandiflorum]
MRFILKTGKTAIENYSATVDDGQEEEGRDLEQATKRLRLDDDENNNNLVAWKSLVEVAAIAYDCEEGERVCRHKDVHGCWETVHRRRRHRRRFPVSVAAALKLKPSGSSNSQINQNQRKEGFGSPPRVRIRFTTTTTTASNTSNPSRLIFKNQDRKPFCNFVRVSSSSTSKSPQDSNLNPPSTRYCNMNRNPSARDSNIPSFEPESPYNMRQRISEATMGKVKGREFKLVIRKELTDTDMNTHHARLLLPNGKIVDRGYVTEEEKRVLYEENDKVAIEAFLVIMGKKNGGDVEQIGKQVGLKKWNMTSCGVCNVSGPSWRELLVKSEKGMVDLRVGDQIELWSFRVNYGELCFALVNISPRFL